MLELTKDEVAMVSGGSGIGFPPGSFPVLAPVYKALGNVLTGQGSVTVDLGVASATVFGDSVGGVVGASVTANNQTTTVVIPVS